MFFAYLLVPGCNGCSYDDGLQLLSNSVNSLRKFLPNSKIYIYYGYDETSKNKIPEIENYINTNNLEGINIGHIKHNFPIIEYESVAQSVKNPYRLNILIEKIYLLINHTQEEEIIFVDLDTEFKENITTLDKDFFNCPVLFSNENPLLNERGLGSFFNKINYFVDPESRMFNSGVIYIPSNKRKLIAEEALELVLRMNEESDKLRLAKDLDEQIAISIIIFKYYKNNIRFFENYLNHFMGRHIKQN